MQRLYFERDFYNNIYTSYVQFNSNELHGLTIKLLQKYLQYLPMRMNLHATYNVLDNKSVFKHNGNVQ